MGLYKGALYLFTHFQKVAAADGGVYFKRGIPYYKPSRALQNAVRRRVSQKINKHIHNLLLNNKVTNHLGSQQ
jgi:hypothetical protein